MIDSGKPKLGIIEKHVTPAGDEMWAHTSKVPYRDGEGETKGVQERTHEFIRHTLNHIQESANRGANRNEILDYVEKARTEFENIKKSSWI